MVNSIRLRALRTLHPHTRRSVCTLYGGKITMYLVIFVCYTKTLKQNLVSTWAFIPFSLCLLFCILCDSHSMWMCVYICSKENFIAGSVRIFRIIIIIIILSIRFTLHSLNNTNCKWLLTIFILIHVYTYRVYTKLYIFQSNPENKWRIRRKKRGENE